MSSNPTDPGFELGRAHAGRPPKYTLEQILGASLGVARLVGLEGLTMGAVAAQIGAKPATLYRYVGNRDELLDATVDYLVSLRELPALPTSAASAQERRTWLADMAVMTRDHLLEVRGAADYLLLNGPTGEAGLRFMSRVCLVLGETGRSPLEVARAYDLFLTVISAYTSKTERLAVKNDGALRAQRLSDRYAAMGTDLVLDGVLAGFTGDMDGSFREATEAIIDWIEPLSAEPC